MVTKKTGKQENRKTGKQGNRETGYTFDPGNAEDLSEKIKTLLLDDTARIEMGQNARRFVKLEFNPVKHYQKLMKIYQQAAS